MQSKPAYVLYEKEVPRYSLFRLTDMEYSTLIIFKSYLASLVGVRPHLTPNYTGRVVFDTMYATGNNSNRFIEGIITDGTLDLDSLTPVALDRHHPIRVLSNQLICQDEYSWDAGVMNSIQKKLLKKGVSI